jgi:hypothetical protein
MAVPPTYTAEHLRREVVVFLATNATLVLEQQREQIRAVYGLQDPDDDDEQEEPDDPDAAPILDADGIEVPVIPSGARGKSVTKQPRRTPGPFSFQAYLRHLLEPTAWGDQVSLTAITQMFGATLSVLNTSTSTLLSFRHERALGDVDVVVCYNGSTHYNAAGELIIGIKVANVVNVSVFSLKLSLILGNVLGTVGRTR